MFKYILKRILIFIPTLVVISLAAFVISLNSPVDPVEVLVNAASSESGLNADNSATEELRQEVRKKLGLDNPVFYFSFSSYADCDTIHKIEDRAQRENLSEFTRRHGNWEQIETYFHSVAALNKSIEAYQVDSITQKQLGKNKVNQAKNNAALASLSLLELNADPLIQAQFSILDSTFKNNQFLASFNPQFLKVKQNYETVIAERTAWKNYIPSFQFNGVKNQYHIWLFGSEERDRKGVVRGDFGNSFVDNKPVIEKMGDVFLNSFVLVILSIVLAYLISIPLGVYSAYKKGSLFDNTAAVIVFMLYSLPSFFVATWLLYKFANPDNFYWFPISGAKDPSTFNKDWGFFSMDRIAHQAPYFVLPLISFTYSSFAFTSRIMRVSMVEIMKQDYMRTASAKGLPKSKVILKHGLRNGLLPIITMFANIFPAAIGGSVILEKIFQFPGMGNTIYQAIFAVDIPTIVAVFTLTGVLTVTGYLVADVLYAVVDPRISFGKK